MGKQYSGDRDEDFPGWCMGALYETNMATYLRLISSVEPKLFL